MRIHFLGIGGTLMGHLALLARELGHEVSGSDGGIYPPMSEVLAAAGIHAHEGFAPSMLTPAPDLVVIGNAGLPRGHPAVEYVLDHGIAHTSGAQFLGEHVLAGRWVLAVSGTHGKTTTTAMLAWILEHAGLSPGYLIGGVPSNFSVSARIGAAPFFVVEADEYDTSYFDRRSKFVHYRPRTLIINNLEYDHADIFPDLAAIQTQFHHLLRTIPRSGLIVVPNEDEAIDEVIERGCWSPVERVADFKRAPRHHGKPNATWRAADVARDGRAFNVQLEGTGVGRVEWSLMGTHNVQNALMAIAAARHAGVSPATAVEALCAFRGVRRRLEWLGKHGDTEYYDDFAHHPTAIRATLQALRDHVGPDELIAVIEPRSHTMSLGTLRDDLTTCCAPADRAIWFRGANIKWDLQGMVAHSVIPARVEDNLDELTQELLDLGRDAGNDERGREKRRHRRHVVLMSNGAFGGLAGRLKAALAT